LPADVADNGHIYAACYDMQAAGNWVVPALTINCAEQQVAARRDEGGPASAAVKLGARKSSVAAPGKRVVYDDVTYASVYRKAASTASDHVTVFPKPFVPTLASCARSLHQWYCCCYASPGKQQITAQHQG